MEGTWAFSNHFFTMNGNTATVCSSPIACRTYSIANAFARSGIEPELLGTGKNFRTLAFASLFAESIRPVAFEYLRTSTLAGVMVVYPGRSAFCKRPRTLTFARSRVEPVLLRTRQNFRTLAFASLFAESIRPVAFEYLRTSTLAGVMVVYPGRNAVCKRPRTLAFARSRVEPVWLRTRENFRTLAFASLFAESIRPVAFEYLRTSTLAGVMVVYPGRNAVSKRPRTLAFARSRVEPVWLRTRQNFRTLAFASLFAESIRPVAFEYLRTSTLAGVMVVYPGRSAVGKRPRTLAFARSRVEPVWLRTRQNFRTLAFASLFAESIRPVAFEYLRTSTLAGVMVVYPGRSAVCKRPRTLAFARSRVEPVWLRTRENFRTLAFASLFAESIRPVAFEYLRTSTLAGVMVVYPGRSAVCKRPRTLAFARSRVEPVWLRTRENFRTLAFASLFAESIRPVAFEYLRTSTLAGVMVVYPGRSAVCKRPRTLAFARSRVEPVWLRTRENFRTLAFASLFAESIRPVAFEYLRTSTLAGVMVVYPGRSAVCKRPRTLAFARSRVEPVWLRTRENFRTLAFASLFAESIRPVAFEYLRTSTLAGVMVVYPGRSAVCKRPRTLAFARSRVEPVWLRTRENFRTLAFASLFAESIRPVAFEYLRTSTLAGVMVVYPGRSAVCKRPRTLTFARSRIEPVLLRTVKNFRTLAFARSRVEPVWLRTRENFRTLAFASLFAESIRPVAFEYLRTSTLAGVMVVYPGRSAVCKRPRTLTFARSRIEPVLLRTVKNFRTLAFARSRVEPVWLRTRENFRTLAFASLFAESIRPVAFEYLRTSTLAGVMVVYPGRSAVCKRPRTLAFARSRVEPVWLRTRENFRTLAFASLFAESIRPVAFEYLRTSTLAGVMVVYPGRNAVSKRPRTLAFARSRVEPVWLRTRQNFRTLAFASLFAESIRPVAFEYLRTSTLAGVMVVYPGRSAVCKRPRTLAFARSRVEPVWLRTRENFRTLAFASLFAESIRPVAFEYLRTSTLAGVMVVYPGRSAVCKRPRTLAFARSRVEPVWLRTRENFRTLAFASLFAESIRPVTFEYLRTSTLAGVMVVYPGSSAFCKRPRTLTFARSRIEPVLLRTVKNFRTLAFARSRVEPVWLRTRQNFRTLAFASLFAESIRPVAFEYLRTSTLAGVMVVYPGRNAVSKRPRTLAFARSRVEPVWLRTRQNFRTLAFASLFAESIRPVAFEYLRTSTLAGVMVVYPGRSAVCKRPRTLAFARSRVEPVWLRTRENFRTLAFASLFAESIRPVAFEYLRTSTLAGVMVVYPGRSAVCKRPRTLAFARSRVEPVWLRTRENFRTLAFASLFAESIRPVTFEYLRTSTLAGVMVVYPGSSAFCKRPRTLTFARSRIEPVLLRTVKNFRTLAFARSRVEPVWLRTRQNFRTLAFASLFAESIRPVAFEYLRTSTLAGVMVVYPGSSAFCKRPRTLTFARSRIEPVLLRTVKNFTTLAFARSRIEPVLLRTESRLFGTSTLARTWVQILSFRTCSWAALAFAGFRVKYPIRWAFKDRTFLAPTFNFIEVGGWGTRLRTAVIGPFCNILSIVQYYTLLVIIKNFIFYLPQQELQLKQ